MTWLAIFFLCLSPQTPLDKCAEVRLPLPGVTSYMQCRMQCRVLATSLRRGVPVPFDVRMMDCTEGE